MPLSLTKYNPGMSKGSRYQRFAVMTGDVLGRNFFVIFEDGLTKLKK